MNPSGHDELKEQQGWATRALEAEAEMERLQRRVDELEEICRACIRLCGAVYE